MGSPVGDLCGLHDMACRAPERCGVMVVGAGARGWDEMVRVRLVG